MTGPARGSSTPLGALIVAAALASVGCGRGPPPRPPQAPAEARAALPIERSLQDLEERLVVAQARVRFWEEMRARHESVSAIAAVTQERHADAIALFEDRQKGKRDAFAKRNRVAARFVPGDAAR